MKITAMRLFGVCTLVLVVASLLLVGCQGQLGLDLSLGDGQQDGNDVGQILSNPAVLLILVVLVVAIGLSRR